MTSRHCCTNTATVRAGHRRRAGRRRPRSCVFTTGSAPVACTGDSDSVAPGQAGHDLRHRRRRGVEDDEHAVQRRVDVRRRRCRRSASTITPGVRVRGARRRERQLRVDQRRPMPSRNSGVENRSRSRSCASAVAAATCAAVGLSAGVRQQRLLVRPLGLVVRLRRQPVPEAVVGPGPVERVEPVAASRSCCGPATCCAAGRRPRARTTASARARWWPATACSSGPGPPSRSPRGSL